MINLLGDWASSDPRNDRYRVEAEDNQRAVDAANAPPVQQSIGPRAQRTLAVILDLANDDRRRNPRCAEAVAHIADLTEIAIALGLDPAELAALL